MSSKRMVGIKDWFTLLTATSPVPMILATTAGITAANPAFARLLGMSSPALYAGQPLSSLFDATAQARFIELSQQSPRGPQAAVTFATALITGTEEKCWVNVDAWVNILDEAAVIVIKLKPEAASEVSQRFELVNRALSVLYEMSQALSQITDEAELLQRACQICVEQAGFRMAWIGFPLQDEAGTIQPQAFAGVDANYVASTNISWHEDSPSGQGPTGKAVRARRTIVMRDLLNDPQYAPWRELAVQRGYQSAITLPLFLDNGELATLSISAPEPDAFGDEEVALLEKLARDLAYGMRSLRHAQQRVVAEEALRSATEFLAGLMDNAPMPIFAMHRDGRFAVINKAWRGLFKCTEVMPLNFQPQDLVGTANATFFKQIAEHTFALGKPLCFEGSLVIGHELRNYIAHGFPLRSADGILSAAGGILLDVTEQRKMEATIRRSEQSLREAQRIAKLGNWQLDITSGAAIWSENMYQVLDITERNPQVLTLEYFRDKIIHPEDRDRALQALSMVFQGLAKYDLEYRVIDRTGQIRHILAKAEVVRDSTGKPWQLVGTIQDITSRKNAEDNLAALNEELVAINEELRVTNEDLERSNTELQASEQRYRRLFDNMLNGFAYCEMLYRDEVPYDFIYIDVNPAFESLTGLKDVIGRPVSEVIPGIRESNPELFATYGRVARTGEPDYLELFIPVLEMWFAVSVYSPEQDHFVAVFDVVTERKRAEAALKASEERYRTVFEQTPAGIYRTTPDGQIKMANPALVTMLGFGSLDELLQRDLNLEGYIDTKEREQFKSAVMQPGGVRNFETVWIRADGSPVTVSETATAYQNDTGEVLYYDGFVVDITARKQAELALRESEQRYRAIVESSPDGIALIHHDRVVFANPAMFAIHGADRPDQLIGKVIFELIPTEEHSTIKLQLEALRQAGDASQLIETNLLRMDGSTAAVELRQSLINWQGQLAHQSIFRDVTARKKLELQLHQMQKLEAVGVLASGIAHDFNNILFGIMGYTDLVLCDLEPGSLSYENQQQVIAASMRAKELVKQILTFSRQAEHIRMPVDLVRIAKDALKLMRASLPSTISIVQRYDVKSAVVTADPIELHQIIMNLCTNAGQAMAQGGTLEITIRKLLVDDDSVSTHGALLPGWHAALTVADTGIGMTPATANRIFEPFFTTKNPGDGTGLGLSVVHGIVSALGGAVTVYSEYGKGSSFNVYLPLTEADEGPFTSNLTPIAQLTGTEHILVVDDEEPLMSLAEQFLKRFGYRVSAFSDSAKALLAFKENPSQFDLLLTDQTMPGLTGMQLARAVIRIKPALPVLIVTGYAHSTLDEEAIVVGVHSLLTKPLVANTLGQAVREALDSRK